MEEDILKKTMKLIKDRLYETINQNKYLMINPIVINNYLLMGNIGKKIFIINSDGHLLLASFN